MKTNEYISSINYINDQFVTEASKLVTEYQNHGVQVWFYHLEKTPSGYGHYKITLTIDLKYKGAKHSIKQTATTTNMEAIDQTNEYYDDEVKTEAWKSLFNSAFDEDELMEEIEAFIEETNENE